MAFFVSCSVGHRHGLDLTWLWLWQRPAATALIQPLAWEPSYATGAALKKTKKERRKENILLPTISFPDTTVLKFNSGTKPQS